ncbi:MAG: LCP family protein, partial [Eggerthellaceae bacterium]|nr:LCP family protein [Eggerthellaceae bacterium]
MFGRRKMTTARSKRTTQRMRSATLGSHVTRRTSPSSASRRSSAQAQNMGFSSARKTRRAERGMVDYVRPATRSGESREQHYQRMGRRHFAQEVQRQSSRRRGLFIVGAVLLVLLVAAAVGVATFFFTVNGKLSLGDSNVESVLVAPEEAGQPYYVMCVAELGAEQGIYGSETDAYLLVRVDESAKGLSLISIPSHLSVQLSDGQMHPLHEAVALGGDAELVSVVSECSGVDIAHFVRTDAQGIAHLVDVAGGLTVDVPEEVDDPVAGSVYMKKGSQVVDAEAAITLLRARNFTGGEVTQAENRARFTTALLTRLLEIQGLDLKLLLDEVSGSVQTDWSAGEIADVADALRGIGVDSIYSGIVPGYSITTNGVASYVAYFDEWTAMMERVEQGSNPSQHEDPAFAVDPGSFTIEIRNGADIAGAAAQMRGILEERGFVVEAIGNV